MAAAHPSRMRLDGMPRERGGTISTVPGAPSWGCGIGQCGSRGSPRKLGPTPAALLHRPTVCQQSNLTVFAAGGPHFTVLPQEGPIGQFCRRRVNFTGPRCVHTVYQAPFAAGGTTRSSSWCLICGRLLFLLRSKQSVLQTLKRVHPWCLEPAASWPADPILPEFCSQAASPSQYLRSPRVSILLKCTPPVQRVPYLWL